MKKLTILLSAALTCAICLAESSVITKTAKNVSGITADTMYRVRFPAVTTTGAADVVTSVITRD